MSLFVIVIFHDRAHGGFGRCGGVDGIVVEGGALAITQKRPYIITSKPAIEKRPETLAPAGAISLCWHG